MNKRVGRQWPSGIQRILAAVLALVLLVTLYPAQPGYAASTSAYAFSFTYDQTDARSMLDLINDFRTGDEAWQLDENEQRVEITGLGELTYDYGLEAIAMQRAAEVSTFWDHTRPNGESCFSLFNFSYGSCGENLAAGNATAQAAFVSLQETDDDYAGQGHRRNMLNRNFNYVGIAKCKIGKYWFYVQEFSKNPTGQAAADAANGAKDVSIVFQNSYIEDSLHLEPVNDSVDLVYGESADLPVIKAIMSPYDPDNDTGIWPERTEISAIADDCTITPEDESIATVVDGRIIAQGAGSTTIAVTRGDKETAIYVWVDQKDLSQATVTLDQYAFPYDGSEHQPNVKSVVLEGKTLTEGVDYEVAEYSDRISDVGEGTVYVYGIGNYTGEASATFTVGGVDLSEAVITLEADTFTYTGEAIEPEFTVTVEGETLDPVDHFDYEYKNNVDAGRGSLTISGYGNYSGTKTAYFTIAPVDISSGTICYLEESVEYNAQAHTPEPMVEIGDFTLWPGDDLTVSYQNNINVGTATVTLTGKGNFTGSIRGTFEITPHPIWYADFDGIDWEYVYTAGPITPKPTVTCFDMTLKEGSDYTLTYKNNVEPGVATIIIAGINNYSETKEIDFDIYKTSLSKAIVTLSQTSYVYSGEAYEPEVTVELNGQTLTKNTDYTVAYEDNTDAGTAYAVITGIGLYEGTLYKEFSIAPLALDNAEMTSANLTYARTSLYPSVTVTLNGKTLKEDKDFYLDWKGTIQNAGSYTITVTGFGNYTGTKEVLCNVLPADFGAASVSALETSYPYTGSAITPAPYVSYKFGTKTYALNMGEDYTVTYENNQEVGTAAVILEGKGNYAGRQEFSFEITAADIYYADISFPQDTYYFTDEAIEPEPIVWMNGVTLIKGTDYEIVQYTNNVEPGQASVLIEGKGHYTGNCWGEFQIALPAPSLDTITVKSTALALTWTPSLGADGYQIYRKTGSGSFSLLDDVYGGDENTYTDKTVASGKKYTYKICAFRGEDDDIVTSADSASLWYYFLARPAVSKTTNTASGITIQWNKITGADSYMIYRDSKKIATVSGNATVTYTDTGAKTNGTKYTYKIKAAKTVSSKVNYSAASAAKVNYFVSRPAKPILKNSASGKLAITWKKNAKATGYQIKYVLGSTSKTVTITKAATVTKTLSVKKGKTYKVYVRSYKTVSGAKYYSAWSAAASLKITR